VATSGGQPGNQNATKGKPWADAIRRALETRGSRLDRRLALDDLAEKLLEKCDEGDMSALRELGDRLDGRPHQSTDVALSGDVNVNRTMYGGKVEP
jgi:hypothetical protein